MLRLNLAIIAVISAIFPMACSGDVLVQLNVNRPFTDVNEKFVSFAIRPEDLYRALDGPHRKTVTRMAAMLGDSYLKFTSDYNFASKADTALRNPSKIIWKGFNRWTRAVNWTMIIPVPYSPSSWDPMNTLKLLNISYMIGITDCIWQLGTDFGSSSAHDYVTELNTLDLMVDSFEPFVERWQIMGADISAGSSVDETRRYIDMSKDLNTAFGWSQPAELVPANSINSYIYENDPALKVLLSKKAPVWLSLPHRTKSSKTIKRPSDKLMGDEVNDGLRWAHTLGEAASMGFDAVFKRLTASDLEKPNFSFYVTALFKKVMGSRVFPARTLNMFARSNKLYTHCANTVSGGIAFMVVNPDDKPIHISVRSTAKFTGTEFWQYTLSYNSKGIVLLNNDKLTLNSTLTPQIRVKNPDRAVQLSTPGMSVSFWVLPRVNLEHCQYTEIEVDEIVEKEKESDEKVLQKRYSSVDRLLKKLIQESSLANSTPTKDTNRGRRYSTIAERPKRFILEDKSGKVTGLGKLFEPILFDEKTLKKREGDFLEKRKNAFQWIKDLWDNTMTDDMLPEHKRETRSTDDYFGTLFSAAKNGKRNAFTKKITEIKKPEKKTKPLFDLEKFDEEEFFKQIDAQNEPEYTRVPEGDVHLEHITNVDGDEIEDYGEERNRKLPPKNVKKVIASQARNEMKPLRLLPTEFYEAFPSFKRNRDKNQNVGGTLNSLFFPEPFSKRATKNNNKKSLSKDVETPTAADTKSAVEEVGQNISKSALEFMLAQEKLSKGYRKDNDMKENNLENEEHEDEGEQEQEGETDEKDVTQKQNNPQYQLELQQHKEDPLDADKQSELRKRQYVDYLTENLENYFNDQDEIEEPRSKNIEILKEELPWWHLSALHKKRYPRALKYQVSDDVWASNMITKEENLVPLGSVMIPEHLEVYEQQVVDNGSGGQSVKQEEKSKKEKLPNKFVSTVKEKVTKFVDIVAHHVSEWYNTLTKHIDFAGGTDSTTPAASINVNAVN